MGQGFVCKGWKNAPYSYFVACEYYIRFAKFNKCNLYYNSLGYNSVGGKAKYKIYDNKQRE